MTTVTNDLTTPERAVALLQAQGIPCHYESFMGSIFIEDDGAEWHFGTVNDTWCADIMHDAAVGDSFGCCDTGVPSDTLDAQALASAIVAALMQGTGVEIWRD
jgi:hypothetical protein